MYALSSSPTVSFKFKFPNNSLYVWKMQLNVGGPGVYGWSLKLLQCGSMVLKVQDEDAYGLWPTWMEMFLNSITWGIWEYRNSPTKWNASLSQVFPAALEHVCHLQEGIHNGAKLLFQEWKTIAKLNLQDLQILSLRYSPTMSPLCFKDPNKFTGCHFIHNTFPTHCLPFKAFFLSAYLSTGMAENNYIG